MSKDELINKISECLFLEETKKYNLNIVFFNTNKKVNNSDILQSIEINYHTSKIKLKSIQQSTIQLSTLEIIVLEKILKVLLV